MIKITNGLLTTIRRGYSVQGELPEELNQSILNFIETLDSIEEARDKAILENIPDDKAYLFKSKYPYWEPNVRCVPGDKKRWPVDGEDRLFLYIGIVETVAQPGWEPHVAHSLWRDLEGEIPGDDGYPNWVQPGGNIQPYTLGFEVIHHGVVYKSTVDHNVWEPGVFGWDEVEN